MCLISGPDPKFVSRMYLSTNILLSRHCVSQIEQISCRRSCVFVLRQPAIAHCCQSGRNVIDGNPDSAGASRALACWLAGSARTSTTIERCWCAVTLAQHSSLPSSNLWWLCNTHPQFLDWFVKLIPYACTVRKCELPESAYSSLEWMLYWQTTFRWEYTGIRAVEHRQPLFLEPWL